MSMPAIGPSDRILASVVLLARIGRGSACVAPVERPVSIDISAYT